DHARHRLEDEAVAPTLLEGRGLELLDQDYLCQIAVVDERGNGIATFEDERFPVGAHGAGRQAVRDRDLVELEETIEYAALVANDDITRGRHYAAPKSCNPHQVGLKSDRSNITETRQDAQRSSTILRAPAQLRSIRGPEAHRRRDARGRQGRPSPLPTPDALELLPVPHRKIEGDEQEKDP